MQYQYSAMDGLTHSQVISEELHDERAVFVWLLLEGV